MLGYSEDTKDGYLLYDIRRRRLVEGPRNNVTFDPLLVEKYNKSGYRVLNELNESHDINEELIDSEEKFLEIQDRLKEKDISTRLRNIQYNRELPPRVTRSHDLINLKRRELLDSDTDSDSDPQQYKLGNQEVNWDIPDINPKSNYISYYENIIDSDNYWDYVDTYSDTKDINDIIVNYCDNISNKINENISDNDIYCMNNEVEGVTKLVLPPVPKNLKEALSPNNPDCLKWKEALEKRLKY